MRIGKDVLKSTVEEKRWIREELRKLKEYDERNKYTRRTYAKWHHRHKLIEFYHRKTGKLIGVIDYSNELLSLANDSLTQHLNIDPISISTIDVKEKFQKKGYGSEMLKWFEGYWAGLGRDSVSTLARHYAVSFFKKNGWKVAPKIVQKEAGANVIMYKVLNNGRSKIKQ